MLGTNTNATAREASAGSKRTTHQALVLAALLLVVSVAHPSFAQLQAPTAIEPSGPNQPSNPLYRWTRVTGAGVYRLQVVYWGTLVVDTLVADSNCQPTECSVQLGTHSNGLYLWQVSSCVDASCNPYALSNLLSFNVGQLPEQAVDLIAPEGAGHNARPTFEWYPVTETVLGYYLYAAGPTQLSQFVDLSACGTTCTFVPSTSLAEGQYNWEAAGYNISGFGPVNEVLAFSTGNPPAPPDQVLPKGPTYTGDPLFEWDAVVGAVSYSLLLYRVDTSPNPSDPSQWIYTYLYDETVPASSACSGPSCAYDLAHPTLGADLYAWWILAENEFGATGWSPGLLFWVVDGPPTAPVAQSPVGPSSASPVYTWTDTGDAASYQFTVKDSTLTVVTQQTVATALQCAAGVCSGSASFLPPGDYTWSVHGINPFGTGPESNVLTFSVSASFLAAGQCHSFLFAEDMAWAWGSNAFGKLGDGTTIDRLTPTALTHASFADLSSIAAGGDHTAAVSESGELFAWGSNGLGQLGVSSVTESPDPLSIIPSGITQVVTGAEHTLVLDSSGDVWAFGSNSDGQLGSTVTGFSNTPAPVTGLPAGAIVAVAAGAYHSLALASDNTIWAWGRDDDGQLGDGTRTSRSNPAQVLSAPGTVATEFVALGSGPSANHALAVKSDGAAWAWGDGSSGQLGNSTFQDALFATPVQGLSNVRQLSAGEAHSVAVLTDNNVWTWGGNSRGQLGNGGEGLESALPVVVSALSNVQVVAAGRRHNLALTEDGSLLAWGGNECGQLGDGTTEDAPSPVAVSDPAFGWKVATPTMDPPGGAFFSTVSVVVDTAMAGSLIHYTVNGLEPTPTDPSVSPGETIDVSGPGVLKIKAFATNLLPSATVAETFTFVATAPTALPPGGYYETSQDVELTAPTPGAVIYYTLDGTEPTPTATLYTSSISIAASTTLKARAYLSGWSPSVATSETYTIDLNATAPPTFDPPGGSYVTNKTVTLRSTTPNATIYYTTDGTKPTTSSDTVLSEGTIPVSRALRLRAIASANGKESLESAADYRITGAVTAGEYQIFIIRNDGTAVAAGQNNFGQLGLGFSGGLVGALSPLDMSNGLSDIQQIAAGPEHALALDGQGRVWSWGSDSYGKLGTGSPHLVPEQVQALAPYRIVEVAAGRSHSLALDENGNVWGWGSQYTNGLGVDSSVPQQVPSLSEIGHIAASEYFGFALQISGGSSGMVFSWGASDANGQLGRQCVDCKIPTPIPNFDNVTHVVAGGFHGLALKTDRTVWSWGWNTYAQLGTGDLDDRFAPVLVENLPEIAAIGAGYQHSFAIGTDGVLWGWGDNSQNQLGDPNSHALPSPAGREVRLLPASVGWIQDVIAVAGGFRHSIALTADGRTWSWGYNDEGQLGIGTTGGTVDFPTPLENYAAADGSWLEGDFDNDGLSNGRELALGTDPANPDTNGDGIRDGAAVATGLSTTNVDVDGDGIPNAVELQRGTSPFLADTDGDGFSDAEDAFPLDPARKTLSPYDPSDTSPPIILLEEPSASLVSSIPP